MSAQVQSKSNQVTCPRCEGKAGGWSFVDGAGIHSTRWSDCWFCKGAGNVKSEQVEWICIGMEFDSWRSEYRITIGDISRILNMEPWDVSACLCGIQNPVSLDKAKVLSGMNFKPFTRQQAITGEISEARGGGILNQQRKDVNDAD